MGLPQIHVQSLIIRQEVLAVIYTLDLSPGDLMDMWVKLRMNGVF